MKIDQKELYDHVEFIKNLATNYNLDFYYILKTIFQPEKIEESILKLKEDIRGIRNDS